MNDNDFFKLIDKIYKGKQDIPWDEFSQYQAGFIKSLVSDLRDVKEIFKGDLLKKGGVSGKDLPISIKIINKDDESPALEKFLGFDSKWVVVYFGICPELENFVSITMWPSENNPKKTSNWLYKEIHDNLKKYKTTINLEGPYYLFPPNEIRPQRVNKITAIKDEDKYYSWPHFPFLKDTGDTLEGPISAINYNRVLLRNEKQELYEDYVTLRVVVASVIDIRGNQVTVKMPFFKVKHHPFTFNININTHIEKDGLYYFLLMYKAGMRLPHVYLYRKINKVGALAHTISWELYNQFLASSSGEEYKKHLATKNIPKFMKTENVLSICSLEEFKDIFEEHERLINAVFINVNSTENSKLNKFDYITKNYLFPFFDINMDENLVSYKPPIFKHKVDGLICGNILKMNKIVKKQAIGKFEDDGSNYF